MSADYQSYLDQCVATAEQCSASLTNSLTNLHPGISDLPRLCKILRNEHHFLVLPQPRVQAHKSELAKAFAPQIDNLISKAEQSLEAQRAKIQRLEERLAIIQQSRMGGTEAIVSQTSEQESSMEDEEEGEEGMESRLGDVDVKTVDAAQRRKVIMLRGKRKRLEEEREKLGI